jgi:hypothetical protein
MRARKLKCTRRRWLAGTECPMGRVRRRRTLSERTPNYLSFMEKCSSDRSFRNYCERVWRAQPEQASSVTAEIPVAPQMDELKEF